MSVSGRSPFVILATGGVLAAVVIFLLTVMSRRKPADGLETRAAAPPVYKQVPSFSLTNHLGAAVDLDHWKGRVWVAQIIFTRCPGPCARMTQFFTQLQSRLPKDGSVRLVSLTSDPEYDTPEILSRYAEKAFAHASIWEFLTGTKRELSQLAIAGLGLTALDKEESERSSPEDLFIHSTISVVVDREGHVRGTVETLEPGAESSLMRLIEGLRQESGSRLE
ncbi:MAG: SCO family protein [Verrucomicrobia bacterium]|nr:SCO family protein [Verrucomicrobiota bacterium]